MDDWYKEDNFGQPQNSCDSSVRVNNFGRSLLWMCQVLNIHIVNGRFDSDKDGHFTCITRQGASVVHYCLVSSNLFHNICDFVVIDQQFSDSVHLPIQVQFKCDLKVVREISNLEPRYKINRKEKDKHKFMEIIQASEFAGNFGSINISLTNNNINDAISNFTCILQNAAKCATPTDTRKRKVVKHNDESSKWWDEELKQLKSQKNVFVK